MTHSFAAYYESGPKWSKGKALKDRPLKPHVDYLLSLHRSGKVDTGGPLADGSGGLVIFSAEHADKMAAMLASDPAIVDEILVATVKQRSRIV